MAKSATGLGREALRQTTLGYFAQCMASGDIAIRHDGGPTSGPALRGTAFHAFAEAAALSLVESQEERMPGEVGKELLAAVMEEQSLNVPPEEMDGLRAMVWNWCERFTLDLPVVGVELPMAMDLAGHHVTGRLDLVLKDEATLVVRDYKTGWRVPPQEEYERSFQPLFYAVLLLHGATADGERVGDGFETVRTENIYPRLVGDDERLASRSATLTRERLDDHVSYLEGLVQRVQRRYDIDVFEATPGSWCETCVAPSQCPLAPELRPDSPPDPPEEPGALAAWLVVADRVLRDARKRLKAHVVATEDPVPVGDSEWGFAKEERRTVDRERMLLEWEQAVYDGRQAEFAPAEFVHSSVGTRFGLRKAP